MSGTIREQQKRYFRSLGIYLTTLRREFGFTQAELSRELGVSQQTVFAYELGERRVSIFILTKLARIFRKPLEELVGISKPSTTNRGRQPSPRLIRHAERLMALSKTQQRFVVRIITVLGENNNEA